MHLEAHLHFCQCKSQTKKCKTATKPTHQRHRKQLTTKQRQTEHQLVTAPIQNAGFRAPKTVLWLINH